MIDIGLSDPVEAYAVHGLPGYSAAYGIAQIAPGIKGRRPEVRIEADDFIYTFLETHPYYKARPVPERDWSKPYRIRFDSEFDDKEA